MKKDGNTWELIKFLITGLVCAIADLLTTSLFLEIFKFLQDKNLDWLQSAIALLTGFIVGVTLNYILSTFWVFKGKQDKSVTKSAKFIILFVLFSIIAYGLSYGTFELCRGIFNNVWGLNINDAGIKFAFELVFFHFIDMWSNGLFWLFILAFFLKTLVGLIWNYFTRKYILYKRKEPMKESPEEIKE